MLPMLLPELRHRRQAVHVPDVGALAEAMHEAASHNASQPHVAAENLFSVAAEGWPGGGKEAGKIRS